MNVFWSPDPLAAGVILFAGAVFLCWLAGLVLEAVRLSRERAWFRKLSDVRLLVFEGRDAGQPATLSRRDDLFKEFATHHGVPLGSAAASHVRALHNAGWSDTRLEIAELNRFTLERLFRRNSALRAVMGLFIVIGLFGTLAGLSKALVPLSGLDLASGVPLDLSVKLRELLEKLQSAFAPSVVGVSLTVLGVLLYSAYTTLVCAPLKALVDRLTTSTWIPVLYPTTSQRVLQTLDEVNRQAREHVAAAERVSGFAERIEDDLSDFEPSLKRARAMLGAFEISLAAASEAAGAMAEATRGLGEFQSTIIDAQTTTGEHTAAIRAVVERLDGQTARLGEGVRVLRVFEEAYVDGLQERTGALLTSARDAIEKLGVQSEEVARAVGDPIVAGLGRIDESLRKELGKIDGALHEGLGGVRKGLSGIEDPVSRSAGQIVNVADTFERNVQQYLGELKREFDRQNNEAAETRAGLAEMSEAMKLIAAELAKASARQDRLVGEVAAIAHRTERPPFWRRVAQRLRLTKSVA